MDLVWTGTDVLYLNEYPKQVRFRFKIQILVFRCIVKILDRYYTGRNWVVSEHLGDKLDLKKPVMLIQYPRSSQDYQHLREYEKKAHEGFNVLYYHPKGRKNTKFIEWLYGIDIVMAVKEYYGNKINLIRADGSLDMETIYPVTDFYLRPNRHDGKPFMVMECQKNNIPYYWSRENPSIGDIIIQINGLIAK